MSDFEKEKLRHVRMVQNACAIFTALNALHEKTRQSDDAFCDENIAAAAIINRVNGV